nr:hypothetical protein CTI12_AA080440 [Tanacetum cinerariifolium]
MKIVLESGPWMVNNVSLVRNIWEPGIWLEKVEPSTIPICVCVYNIPMDLCDGNGIGKIMSGEVLKGGGSVINKGDNGNLDEYGLVEVGMKNMHVLCK